MCKMLGLRVNKWKNTLSLPSTGRDKHGLSNYKTKHIVCNMNTGKEKCGIYI